MPEPDPLRVVLVCPYDMTVPGGVQSHVSHLAERLRTAGDQVLVLAPARADPPAGVTPVGGSVGVRFNDSVAPITLSPFAPVRALRRIEDFAPDVVHVHEPVTPLLSLAVTARTGLPLVGTFHAWSDSDLVYRTARPVLRRVVDRLSARIAVSSAATDFHAAALGLPPASFREVPNGVDVDRFATAQPRTSLRGDGPLLLFVGRLERRKGLETLIRAFVRLKAHLPGVVLAVVGDGPEADRCASLLPGPLRSDVRFLGRVDQQELPGIYAAADLFVSPALGGESFGIVLVEALAAGVPVVASAIPGYETVIRDGVDGRLVTPGSVEGFAEAIRTLLGNASLREALAEQGRERARRFDWQRVARDVRAIYDAVRR